MAPYVEHETQRGTMILTQLNQIAAIYFPVQVIMNTFSR